MSSVFRLKRLEKGEKIILKGGIELRPSAIYVLPEGSIYNKPSLCMIMSDAKGQDVVAGQLSIKMLLENTPSEMLKDLSKAIMGERMRRMKTYVVGQGL